MSDIPPFPGSGGGDIPAFPTEVAAPKGGMSSPPPVSPPPAGPKPQAPSPEAPAPGFLSRTGRDLVSLGDLVGSIPASVVGVAEDVEMRLYGMAKGMGHKEQGELGNLGFQTAIDKYGNPVSKIVALAGLGGKDDGTAHSDVDTIMGKISGWLEKGGEKVEKETGGYLTKEDVSSLVNAAMAAGGGKGLKAGVEKMFGRSALAEAGVRLSPQALHHLDELRTMQSEKPLATREFAESGADAAVKAKTRLVEAKDLVYDPLKGTFHERVPEPGKPLPKPTSLETGLEKVAAGNRWALTAEERIALRGHEQAPLEKPIVDEQGKVIRPGGARWKQSGQIDPKLLSRMAAVGLGAWAGVHYDNQDQFVGAVLGGLGGMLLADISPKKAVSTLKTVLGKDPRYRIDDFANAHEKFIGMGAADIFALQSKGDELVPKLSDRPAITHAIESGDFSKLTPNQVEAAEHIKKYYRDMGEVASAEGVLKGGVENYITHVWDWSKNKGFFERWMGARGVAASMSTKSRFAKERTIPTIAEGKAAGLTPLTEDPFHLAAIYGNSMNRAIANSIFVRALKLEEVPGSKGLKMIMKSEDAPHQYVPINNPSLAGMRVHPDIAPSLKMLYDTSTPGNVLKVIQMASDTLKRNVVSLSFFHPAALAVARLFARKWTGEGRPAMWTRTAVGAAVGGAVGGVPGAAFGGMLANMGPDLLKIARGQSPFLDELKKGSASPLVEDAMEGGLKISMKVPSAAVEDAGPGFYPTLKYLQGVVDRTIPHSGLPLQGLAELNHAFDKIIWDRIHTGWKLELFSETKDNLLQNSVKKNLPMSREDASTIAASYTNDIFGGLNWRRVAESAQSRLMREIAHAMLNPGSRRVLQIFAFALDWAVSTTRAVTSAWGKPDFINPTTKAGLAQQYVMRAAVYYFTVANAVNYAYSGRYIWQNKDPTVIDMNPEGSRHMQWSKHTMEPLHWVTKPRQQAINKLGMLPKEAIEQMMGVDYLNAQGRMPPMKNHWEHLFKLLDPISVQQFQDTGVSGGMAGFAGFPVYGKTEEQKREEKRQRDRQRREHRKHKYSNQ